MRRRENTERQRIEREKERENETRRPTERMYDIGKNEQTLRETMKEKTAIRGGIRDPLI